MGTHPIAADRETVRPAFNTRGLTTLILVFRAGASSP